VFRLAKVVALHLALLAAAVALASIASTSRVPWVLST
jgi:hypothetical protein